MADEIKNQEPSTAPKSGFAGKLDSFFGISKAGSTIGTEIIAGVTTFLAMAYILAVNPNMLAHGNAGIPGVNDAMWDSLYIATILGAVFGTLMMGLVAKLPFAQASGMGINAMVFFTLMLTFGLSYGAAMWLTILAGLLFVLLTVVGVREKIVNAIPKAVRVSIPVGIGLFIAFIGLQGAQIIVDGVTLVEIVAFNNWETCKNAVVCLIGFFTIAILSKLNVKGSILFGMLFATIIGIPCGVTNVEILKSASWLPAFDKFFSGDPSVSSLVAVFGNIGGAFKELFGNGVSVVSSLIMILNLAMIDMFDTFGTLYGTSKKAGILVNDEVPHFREALLADSLATVFGGCMGTSTVTTYVESASGVSVGGRTGLTAVVVAALFLVSLFLAPIFTLIPSAASGAALIYVGVLMMTTIKDVDFSDITVAVPAFLTLFMMPLGYSITDGIGMGIISYVIIASILWVVNWIKSLIKKEKCPKWEINWITLLIFALYIVMYVTNATYGA